MSLDKSYVIDVIEKTIYHAFMRFFLKINLVLKHWRVRFSSAFFFLLMFRFVKTVIDNDLI